MFSVTIFCFAKWQEFEEFLHTPVCFVVALCSLQPINNQLPVGECLGAPEKTTGNHSFTVTTHHTSLCSVASFVCKTCHLRTCEQICSLTMEGSRLLLLLNLAIISTFFEFCDIIKKIMKIFQKTCHVFLRFTTCNNM